MVDNEPGKGSRFRVDLPRVEADVVAQEVWDRPIRGGHERILYVDDEELLRLVVEQMLARIGYHATVRSDGVEALELGRDRPNAFDLVMAEQNMPSMTGTRLARELSSNRPGIPILLMTGLGRLARTEEEPAIRECLSKPFTYQELSEAIRRLLAPPPGDP